MNTLLKLSWPCWLLFFLGVAGAQDWVFDVSGPNGLQGQAHIRGQEVRLRIEQGGCRQEMRGVLLEHSRSQLLWSYRPGPGASLIDLGRRAHPRLTARPVRLQAQGRVYHGQLLGRSITWSPRGPDISLSGNHPGARLARHGDSWVLHSNAQGAAQGLGFRPKVQLAFAGHQVELEASWDGKISVDELGRLLPEGFFAEALGERILAGGSFAQGFRLQRDPPGTLSLQEAARLAREELITDLKGVHSQTSMWRDTFPVRWEGMVRDGVLQDLDAFFDPAGETEVLREHDAYVFIGRGPYELYTEVRVSKDNPSDITTLVEID